MGAITKRNLKLFFRDKAGVFFSLLSVLIIIGLYALFLGDTMTGGLEDVEGVDWLMNSWVVAGILAVISMTSTLGAYGIMVEDRAKKIDRDFFVSPLKRGAVTMGYVFSAVCVGIVMSVAALAVGELYIWSAGGELLNAAELFAVLGGIVLSVLSSSAIVCLLVTFFKSQNAYTTASIVIGTLIGFLTGMYIPVGSLGEGVQAAVKAFPVSYSASYFRTVMMERPMETSFAGAPAGMADDFKSEMGIYFNIDGQTTTLLVCVIVMLATAGIFYALAIANMARKKRR